jgi:hypothetical protein
MFLKFFKHYDTWRFINFLEKWTELSSPSFPKIQVSSVIRIEIEVPKNKVFKIQVLKTYLTNITKNFYSYL